MNCYRTVLTEECHKLGMLCWDGLNPDMQQIKMLSCWRNLTNFTLVREASIIVILLEKLKLMLV